MQKLFAICTCECDRNIIVILIKRQQKYDRMCNAELMQFEDHNSCFISRDFFLIVCVCSYQFDIGDSNFSIVVCCFSTWCRFMLCYVCVRQIAVGYERFACGSRCCAHFIEHIQSIYGFRNFRSQTMHTCRKECAQRCREYIYVHMIHNNVFSRIYANLCVLAHGRLLFWEVISLARPTCNMFITQCLCVCACVIFVPGMCSTCRSNPINAPNDDRTMRLLIEFGVCGHI